MAKVSEADVVADGKTQEATAADAPSDQSATVGATATKADVPAATSDVANPLTEAGEHPLDIISEIEHLLRIVGNVAVHEFRRISERLADLKNHPAIKPGE